MCLSMCARVCICVCGVCVCAARARARACVCVCVCVCAIWAKLQLFVDWLYFLVTRACDIITQLCQTWGGYKNKNENMIWFANWT